MDAHQLERDLRSLERYLAEATGRPAEDRGRALATAANQARIIRIRLAAGTYPRKAAHALPEPSVN